MVTSRNSVICSFCNIHPSIVTCRDGCGNGICFACVLSKPTGGQCQTCFDKFASVHLKNHVKELDDPDWLDYYTKSETQQIELIGRSKKEGIWFAQQGPH